jgi:hypothetical protein
VRTQLAPETVLIVDGVFAFRRRKRERARELDVTDLLIGGNVCDVEFTTRIGPVGRPSTGEEQEPATLHLLTAAAHYPDLFMIKRLLK